MNNFEFYNPTRIVFGKGKIAELNRLVPKEAKQGHLKALINLLYEAIRLS